MSYACHQYVGGRATVTKRRLNRAFIELTQIAQIATYEEFAVKTLSTSENAQRVRDESSRLLSTDQKKAKERVKVGRKEQWRLELQDAFSWASKMGTRMNNMELLDKTAPELIGKFGFRRLLLDGKLLDLPLESVDEYFNAVDADGKCYVTFDNVWIWFKFEASRRHKEIKAKNPQKGFSFVANDIFTAETRALITLMRRFAEMDALAYSENAVVDSYDNSSFFNTGKGDHHHEEEESEYQDSEDGIDLNDERVQHGDEFGDDLNGKLMALLRLDH
jgi:hypothetical protein